MYRLRAVVALMLVLAAFSAAQDTPAPEGNLVLACRLEGMIDDGLAVLTKRVIQEAKTADAIIFIIDTPGGKVDSAIEITDAITEAPCRTIAYIKGMGAISAGAIVSYACDEMYMSPATNIGAAQPVYLTGSPMGGAQPLPAGEKEVSYIRAKIASLAQSNGHNADIAQAMVDEDVELRAYRMADGTLQVRAPLSPSAIPGDSRDEEEAIDQTARVIGRVIRELADIPEPDTAPPTRKSEPAPEPVAPPDNGTIILARGKLLTLTPNEALQYGVIKQIVNSLDEVTKAAGLENATIRVIEMTWSEALFRWLTSPVISGLLLMIGIGGIYIELRTPGFGVPGIVGIACLALFFGARAVIGLSTWIDMLLVAIGLVLLAIEFFVLPGFGFVGAAGIVCVLAGLVLSFTYSDFKLPEYQWEFDRLEDLGFTLTVTFVSLVAAALVLWKTLPKTPLYGKLILAEAQDISRGYVVQTEEDRAAAVGLHGMAVSMLRPAGKGRFGDRTLQVVSRGQFIEPGTPIVIVEVEGNRYVVDPVKGTAEAAPRVNRAT